LGMDLFSLTTTKAKYFRPNLRSPSNARVNKVILEGCREPGTLAVEGEDLMAFVEGDYGDSKEKIESTMSVFRPFKR